MRAGRAFRKAVLDRLIAEIPAIDGRAYDRATETDAYPFVTLGPSYWVNSSVECVTARNVTLQVDIWCSSGAGDPTTGHPATGKGNAEDVVDDVTAALDGWTVGDALAASPLRVTLVRVMDDPSGCVHGVVQVTAMVEG